MTKWAEATYADNRDLLREQTLGVLLRLYRHGDWCCRRADSGPETGVTQKSPDKDTRR